MAKFKLDSIASALGNPECAALKQEYEKFREMYYQAVQLRNLMASGSTHETLGREEMPVIDPADINIEPWPQRGGGQQVGGGSQGVKITHEPTGITITVDVERSQHRNRMIAMDALAGALTSPHLRT